MKFIQFLLKWINRNFLYLVPQNQDGSTKLNGFSTGGPWCLMGSLSRKSTGLFYEVTPLQLIGVPTFEFNAEDERQRVFEETTWLSKVKQVAIVVILPK